MGLHSFEDLTKHIKTRIDDSHAPPGECHKNITKIWIRILKVYFNKYI